MDYEQLRLDIRDLRFRNKSLGKTVLVLSLCNLAALVGLVRSIGNERTVVTPPSINKSFWVDRDKASSEYLEQMGTFLTWLVLDVSPTSIDWKKEILLSYVSPDKFGALKTRQEVEAERLKRINAATTFAPQQLVASEDKQNLVVYGRLRTLVNGLETSNELKSYELAFSFSGGRMHLTQFEEVAHVADPKAR